MGAKKNARKLLERPGNRKNKDLGKLIWGKIMCSGETWGIHINNDVGKRKPPERGSDLASEFAPSTNAAACLLCSAFLSSLNFLLLFSSARSSLSLCKLFSVLRQNPLPKQHSSFNNVMLSLSLCKLFSVL